MVTYAELDPFFWRDYRLFAAKARVSVGHVLLDTYLRAQNDRARRMYGARIFDELMLATEDLYMVFAAFRDRDKQPPLQTMIALNLGGDDEKAISALLSDYTDVGDAAIWSALRLPNPEDGAALRAAFPDPNTDLSVVAHYLRVLVGALHNARENRVLSDRSNVRLLNKLKHGFVAVDNTTGWPDTQPETDPPSPLSVTVLLKGAEAGTVARWGVRVDETAVRAYVETISTYAGAADVIAFLCHELQAPGEAEQAPSAPPPSAVKTS